MNISSLHWGRRVLQGRKLIPNFDFQGFSWTTASLVWIALKRKVIFALLVALLLVELLDKSFVSCDRGVYRWDFWKERKWIRCEKATQGAESHLLSRSDYAAVQIRSPRTRPTLISTETNLTKRLWSAPRPATVESTWRTRTNLSRRTLTFLIVSTRSQIVTVT